MTEHNKTSLHNADVIIAYRGGSADREENLNTVLRHFDLTYDNYRVLLLEADAAPRFKWSDFGDNKVHHIFVPHSGPFPKAMLYNMGAKLSSSAVLIFNDADCIAEPASLSVSAAELINFNAYDVLLPYMPVFDVNGGLKARFAAHPDFTMFGSIDKDHLVDGCKLLYERNAGGVIVFRRSDFIKVGGLNSKFVGWGGEDSELLWRSERLGLRWASLPPPLFHLNHASENRPEWGDISNEGYENGQMANSTQTMPIEQLQALADELRQFFN